MHKKVLLSTALIGLGAALTTCATAQTVDQVYGEFARVPDSTRTKVWWFHGENITTREGITADLEAYKRQGVGGVVYYDQQHGPGAPGALPSMSPEWWAMLKHAAREARRLGLSFEINISNGYVCGGPWITPELGMQALFSSETMVKGGARFSGPLPPIQRKGGRDVAVLAFPMKAEMHQSVKCLPDGFATKEPAKVVIAEFDRPFTARSLSYSSTGYSKGAQSIINEPCDPQDNFCGNNFTLLPDIGELEVSDDGLTWRTVCSLAPCYRMQSLQRNFTISFPATTGRYFRLNLHDWDDKGRELKISNVELSARAATYRWEERAAYASEYITPSKTPAYSGDEVIDTARIIDLTPLADGKGNLSWTAPKGTDWLIMRFAYAPTRARTKHGRPNLMGLECSKLSPRAAELHWNSYAQVIIDSLSAIGCPPAGVCMDSHEAGQQNWEADFPELFRQRNGYDITPWLPAMRGYIVGSPDKTEHFLSDLRRTIADGISTRYLATLQRMADKAGVSFTAQATGNGQSICSDNLMAKGFVDRPQGEFWARNHDGSYDIKEASSAINIYGGSVASAEAYTDFAFTDMPGDVKDETDMAAVFHVSELVVCASESQPWLDRYPGNNGFNRDYALNRGNTIWPFTRPFWDYQARNSLIQRTGKPVIDILVYAGDEAPMKLLAHRLPQIPEGYDFDVCTTDALHNRLRLSGKRLVSQGGVSYPLLAIEKSAAVRPETERLIAAWKAQGLPVYDNRTMPDDALGQVLAEAGISPDIRIKSRRSATDRVFFNHRKTSDADFYFVMNHSKKRTFCDTVTLRTDRSVAEWWSALDGSRRQLQAERTAAGLRLRLHLTPDEAGYIVAADRTLPDSAYAPLLNRHSETATAIAGPWTVTFDTLLGGPKKPVAFDTLTDWTESDDPDIRHFSGLATYENTFKLQKPGKGNRVLLRAPGVRGIAKVTVNGKDAGILWCTPWETDITPLVRKGRNTVRIEVRNSIVNRLVGDASLPEDRRKTWAYTELYNAKSRLVPSGITGQVSIVEVEQAGKQTARQ